MKYKVGDVILLDESHWLSKAIIVRLRGDFYEAKVLDTHNEDSRKFIGEVVMIFERRNTITLAPESVKKRAQDKEIESWLK